MEMQQKFERQRQALNKAVDMLARF